MQERKPRYAPDFVCKLIKVAAVLHNICIDGNILFNEKLMWSIIITVIVTII